jgi:hypothetical protein
MPRGFLYNLLNIPPLVFRFQFHPDMMQEKRSYTYKQANSFGAWGAERTEGASGFVGTVGALYEDLKDFGALLTATRPLESEEAEPRTISLDFVLDADLVDKPVPTHVFTGLGRNIQQDLAILRSFVQPSWDHIDIIKMAAPPRKVACWNRPPECSLSYGGLSLTCVMTDLNIKTTAFFDNADPRRCEISVTLKEQPWSLSSVIDFGTRIGLAASAMGRSANFGRDVLEAALPEAASAPILDHFD